jgi:hypothetical protein
LQGGARWARHFQRARFSCTREVGSKRIGPPKEGEAYTLFGTDHSSSLEAAPIRVTTRVTRHARVTVLSSREKAPSP